MKWVYYPYFKMEELRTGAHYKHERNLKVLALVAPQILIPARHLVDMKPDHLNMLDRNIELFQKKIITSRVPNNMSGLKEYYDHVCANKAPDDRKRAEERCEKIRTHFYQGNDSSFEKYSVDEQQLNFKQYLIQFVRTYLKKYKHDLKETDKHNLEFVLKSLNTDPNVQCREGILGMIKKMIYSQAVHKDLIDGIDVIYCVAGMIDGDTKISFNLKKCSESCRNVLKDVIPSIGVSINKHYAPKKICEFFEEMGVFDENITVEDLTIDDVIYMRNQKCFEIFAKEYEKYSTRRDFGKYYEQKKDFFKTIRRWKRIIISLMISFVVTAIFWMSVGGLFKTALVAVASYMISAILSWIAQKKIKTDFGILDWILYRIDPVSLFLYKLRWRLEIEPQ